MSCKFDGKKCLNCGKYNGCLLQTIHSNILKIYDTIGSLIDTQNVIISELSSIKRNEVVYDTLDISSDIEEVNKKLLVMTNIIKDYDMDRDELNIDISQMKSSLTTLELKVDNITNSLAYVLK